MPRAPPNRCDTPCSWSAVWYFRPCAYDRSGTRRYIGKIGHQLDVCPRTFSNGAARATLNTAEFATPCPMLVPTLRTHLCARITVRSCALHDRHALWGIVALAIRRTPLSAFGFRSVFLSRVGRCEDPANTQGHDESRRSVEFIYIRHDFSLCALLHTPGRYYATRCFAKDARASRAGVQSSAQGVCRACVCVAMCAPFQNLSSLNPSAERCPPLNLHPQLVAAACLLGCSEPLGDFPRDATIPLLSPFALRNPPRAE